MTAAHLATREAVVSRLDEAGWSVAGWERLFEDGVSLTPEAQAEYAGDLADLRLGYWAAEGYLQLDCADREESETLRLRLYPRAGVEAVLAHVTRWQGSLSAAMLPDFVLDVAPACRGIFLDAGDQFVSLSVAPAAGEG